MEGKNDRDILMGGLMVLAIIVMVFVVYNHTNEDVLSPRVSVVHHIPKFFKKKTKPVVNAAPDSVAIRSPCVVTMPPAPSRDSSGDKTALFSGNWFTENCPYSLQYDEGSFRGDPYQSRGQESANDWTCATLM